MTPAVSKVASSIADRIAQQAKSGSSLERLTTMKSDKVDSAAKVVPKPIPQAAEIDSSAEKKELVWIAVENPPNLFRGKLLRVVHS
ncbi:hypothetical protein ACFX2G_013321 [Malus domestica]